MARAALAQSPVALTIDTRSPGPAVAPDFGVFSFETDTLQSANKHHHSNGYFFDATNTQLITLFHNLGVRSLRIGGDSVDTNYMPSTRDIDSFFGFVKASGVKVIYSLDLAGGKPGQDARTAKYIWKNYRTNLICLAIGNEPTEYKVNGKDRAITNFQSYIKLWKPFSSAVIRKVPGVRLGGPDNDGNSFSWDSDFARAERGSANLSCLLYHYKPLKSARDKTAAQLIAGELSSDLDTSNYPSCCHHIGAIARACGLPYRFTEFNDYVAGKSKVKDDSFATALFALDALHWWAAHDCLGVYFHTWMNGFHATFYCDTNGIYQLYPISYGIAAFSVGGYGDVEPLTINNVEGLNLASYAVKDDTNLYVTLINKEYGARARTAAVTITPNGFATGNVSAMFLVQANNDVSATSGVTLGGETISGAAPWLGQWTTMGSLTNGQCVIKVPASSAVVLKISADLADRHPESVH